MRAYKVKAYNPVWFGGLRHMTMGEEHYTKGDVFPNIMRFFRFVKDSKGEGACYGIFLYDERRNTFLFPAPADIVGKRKRGGDWKVLTLRRLTLPTCKEEKLLPLIRGSLTAFETVEGYAITSKGLEAWMETSPDIELVELKDLVKTEMKVGLKIDKDTKTAQESMLYFQERVRLKDGISFVFLANRKGNWSFLGGERNPAVVEEVKNLPELFSRRVQVKKGRYYKLYLLTHTYIEEAKEGKEIKLRGIESKMELKFELAWIFSRGSEFVSGYGKPALEMLKPGCVLVLKATTEGDFSSLCQVLVSEKLFNIDNLKRFNESGWNTGTLTEGGIEDE